MLDVHGGRFVGIEEIVERAVLENEYFGKRGGVTVSGGEPNLQRIKLLTLFRRLHEEGISKALYSNDRLFNDEVK